MNLKVAGFYSLLKVQQKFDTMMLESLYLKKFRLKENILQITFRYIFWTVNWKKLKKTKHENEMILQFPS